MNRQPITMFCYTDISGQVRGKGFPTHLLEKRLNSGIGWTPTNIMFTALGTIAPSPWGPFGDLVLMPDKNAEVRLDFGDRAPKEHFFLSDVLNTDGTSWECCPRMLLRNAVEALRGEAGLELRVAFEHEFVYFGANSRLGDGYALDAVRRHREFGEIFLGALYDAGIQADSYLAEFSPGQFEVTFPPVDPLAACDQAVILREIARATAYHLNEAVSFAPRVAPSELGNGLHIHFSFWDKSGSPVGYDDKGPQGVGQQAQHFLAGIIAHMPALCAFTAPSPISYLRLLPHTWTAVWSNIGYRDREAGIRICPTFETSQSSTAEQFNFEYRAADATANPYIQLAVIIKAGLEGLRNENAMPEPTVGIDPEELNETERKRRSIVRLPKSLGEALTSLNANPTVKGFLPPRFMEAYHKNKQAELDLVKDSDPAEMCRRYVQVY